MKRLTGCMSSTNVALLLMKQLTNRLVIALYDAVDETVNWLHV